MKTAAAGLAAAWVLLQIPPASAQDAPTPAEAAAYGPEPPPQVMGPFEKDGAPAPEAAGVSETTRAEGSPAEFDRLFGEEAASAAPSTTPPRLPTPQMPLWLWGLLGLMLLALLVSRRTLLPGKRQADEGIRVTSRTSLGREGNLAVVEVGDGTGGRRRLLVGFGSGAPRLVADLTPMPEVLTLAQETLGPRPVPTVVEAEETPPPPRRRRSGLAPAPPESRTLAASAAEEPASGSGMTTSQRWESAMDAEGAAPPRRTQTRPLESRGDLIAEVLAERTRRSVEVGGEIDLDEALPADDEPAVRGTYTFRGTQG